MQISFRNLFFFFALFYSVSLAARSSKNPIDLQKLNEKEKSIQSLSRSSLDKSSRSSFSLKAGWKKLENVSASLQNTSSLSNRGLEKRGRFLLRSRASESTEDQFKKADPLVLINSRTSVVGVLTGVMILRLKSAESLQEILNEYSLSLVQKFPDLSVFYVTSVDDEFDLKTTFEELSKESRIESIELEVLGRSYEKR